MAGRVLSEQGLRGGRGERIGCAQRRRRGEAEARREGGMIRELVLAGLVEIAACGDQVAEGTGAEGVVVPVAVAGPADPGRRTRRASRRPG